MFLGAVFHPPLLPTEGGKYCSISKTILKWLYNRRGRKGEPGRTLTPEDIEHDQRMVVALNKTIRLMAEIDDLIEKFGGGRW